MYSSIVIMGSSQNRPGKASSYLVLFQRENTHLSLDKIINTYNIPLEVAERLELYSVFETILLNELTKILLEGNSVFHCQDGWYPSTDKTQQPLPALSLFWF